MNPFKAVLDIQRLISILGLVLRFSLGFLFYQLPPAVLRTFPFWSKQSEGLSPQQVSEKVTSLLMNLGPTFIKFGQLLSSRADLFPQDFIQGLLPLQDETPAVDIQKIRTALKSEWGVEVEDKIKSIDDTPLAVGSLAQVHRATLKNGEVLAIKIIKPGSESKIKKDLRLLKMLARFFDRYFEEIRAYDFPGLADEFASSIKKELDFRMELSYHQRFLVQSQDWKGVRCPELYPALCTRRVLAMEYIIGVPLSHIQEKGLSQEELSRLAKNFAEVFIRSIYIHRFFHADPHGGNILVDQKGELVMLDFGMMDYISTETIDGFASLAMTLLGGDSQGVSNSFRRIGFVVPREKEEAFESHVIILAERYYTKRNDKILYRDVFHDLMSITQNYDIRSPSRLLLFFRAVTLVEGLALSLDKNLDLLTLSKGYAKKRLAESLIEKIKPGSVKNLAMSAFKLANRLPPLLEKTISQMEQGEFNIKQRNPDVRKLAQEIYFLRRDFFRFVLMVSVITGSYFLAVGQGHMWIFYVTILSVFPLGMGILLLGGRKDSSY